jgi:hypothetical protein
MTPKAPSRGYVEAWEVESLTEPGKVYNVSKRKDESFACSCPRWKFATAPKPDCKHIRALRVQLLQCAVASPIPTMPRATSATAPATEFVNVYFGTSFVARLSTVEAARLRANLQAAKQQAEPVITAEFSIRRKFRFDQA